MNINKIITSIITISILFLSSIVVYPQSFSSDKEQRILNSLETLDNEIVKYFPRWKVCEPNLQLHIYNIFKQAGYPADRLNSSNIEVLAAPGQFDTENGNYQLLLVQCGDAAMQTSKINLYFTAQLRKKLSGEESYSGVGIGRTYCYKEIPPEAPVSTYQAEAIINYYQPTDVTHAISLSLFEQDLKLGESGFWIKNVFGNDDAGYQFWASGQVAVQLQRPLYVNKDIGTSRAIPYLLSFYIGGGYRISSGLHPEGTMFSWVPKRVLNASQSGDFVAGLDFHLPFAPEFGISAYARVPFESPKTKSIRLSDWGYYDIESLINDEERDEVIDTLPGDKYGNTYNNIVPVMHSSGRISLFYNLWLDKKKPENYFRFDLGLNYAETREMALIGDPISTSNDLEVRADDITGLLNYKPEGLDWLYFKLEYRNQATWPFGASLQISNQILLTKVWVPLLGNWFLLEAKYSNVLRDARPFELKNFFMISPVIRITI
ncbi:MAG: hypothetical protein FWG85_00755 [Bacteroidetes bacterium]|nr:hypothetical protein [Bacteroidota bacterium]